MSEIVVISIALAGADIELSGCPASCRAFVYVVTAKSYLAFAYCENSRSECG
jgi:hypothetical protein